MIAKAFGLGLITFGLVMLACDTLERVWRWYE